MKVVIDDAADLSEELRTKYNIANIPVNVHFGTEQFLTGENMTHDQFYRKAANVNDDNWPKTSQPSPYQFEEFYRKLMAEGERDILTITVGEKLSGTYPSAIAARKEIGDEANITVFNSETASGAQGMMAVEAVRMDRDGASLDEILDRLAEIRDEHVITLVINSLEWAVKGGRVSGLRGMMASLLNIKPIMYLFDGEVVEAGKVRTHKKALRFMADFAKEKVGDKPVRLSVLHANAAQEAEDLLETVKPMFNAQAVHVVNLCVPVAINLGPGTLGLILLPYYGEI
jgi:DegV family protein with EDD domain